MRYSVGAGLDDPGETAAFLRDTGSRNLTSAPVVVLDAFALGVLDQVPAAADGLAGRLVLTPNTKELERLGGERVAATDEADLRRGRRFRDKAVVVVGGGDSAMEEATFLRSSRRR